MTPEESKTIIRCLFDILRTGDLGRADELVAEDYVNYNPILGQASGNRMHGESAQASGQRIN
jgi:ketosteroid isomerase-like protein